MFLVKCTNLLSYTRGIDIGVTYLGFKKDHEGFYILIGKNSFVENGGLLLYTEIQFEVLK
jgi:hypothetical protein